MHNRNLHSRATVGSGGGGGGGSHATNPNNNPSSSPQTATTIASSSGSNTAHRNNGTRREEGRVLAPWERLSRSDVERMAADGSRAFSPAYLLTTAAAMRSVHLGLAATLPSGVPAIDALLSRASSVPQLTGRQHDHGHRYRDGGDGDVLRSSPSPDGGGGVDGWVVGSLSEVCAPPMAGKTFLLHRSARSFLQRQSIIRQQHKLHTWDLYVCLFDGSDGFTDGGSSNGGGGGGASRCAQSWARQLRSASITSDVSGSDSDVGDDRTSINKNDNNTEQHQQRHGEEKEYEATHTHLVSLSHPNDLLSFLTWLADSLDDMATTTSTEDRTTAQATAHDTSDKVAVHASSSSSSSSPQQQQQQQQVQTHSTLVVVDSLALVWGHAALQGSQHSVRWFSAELRRLLRRCLTRRWCPNSNRNKSIVEGGGDGDGDGPMLITTTALVANGSTRFPNIGGSQFQSHGNSNSSNTFSDGGNQLRGHYSSLSSVSGSGGGGRRPTFAVHPGQSSYLLPSAPQQHSAQAAFFPASSSSSPTTGAVSVRCNRSGVHSTLKQQQQQQQQRAEDDNDSVIWYPLGDDGWLMAPDRRLLLTPAEHTLLSVATATTRTTTAGGGGNGPPSSKRHRDDESSSSEDTADQYNDDKDDDGSCRNAATTNSSNSRRSRNKKGARALGPQQHIALVPVPGQAVSRATVMTTAGAVGGGGGGGRPSLTCIVPCEIENPRHLA